MTEITFYRQVRRDGGIRMGLEADGESLIEDFQEGNPDLQDDPLASALEWYVDVRCFGDGLPDDTNSIHQWLMDHSVVICEGMNRFAREVGPGTDDAFPLKWSDFPNAPPGTRIEVVCSAVNRVSAQRLSDILMEFSDRFTDHLAELAHLKALMR